MDEFLSILGNFGFPVAVASYLLLKVEKTLAELTCEIRDLKEAINDLPDKLGRKR